MSYPQEFVQEVLDYIDQGYSLRKTAAHFGISTSTVEDWKLKRDQALGRESQAPLNYIPEVIGKALALAYGDSGMTIRQVAQLFGVSTITLRTWKRRYITEGAMEIPELSPDKFCDITLEGLRSLDQEDLIAFVSEVLFKASVMESLVDLLKVEGIDS